MKKRKVKIFLDIVDKLLVANSNEEFAANMSSYMKDNFEFYGIKSPLRKELLKPYWPHIKVLDLSSIKYIILTLWDKPQRENQYVAMDILNRKYKVYDETCIDFVEFLIQNKSWWDTVDLLASNPIGRLFLKYPEYQHKYVYKWIDSDDMWLKRSALLCQLKYTYDVDFDLLSTLILKEIDNNTFFIQKAIGWSLRQYAKYKPEVVREFVNENPNLSTLAKREALKYF